MSHMGERSLGPSSQLWRYAGDMRIGFLGGPIGLLQLMHPAIGAGVLEHSNFFEDPAHRVFRSLPQILGVVYDEDPHATGRLIRHAHRRIKGTDDAGRRYRALDPETFWWAHATFQYMAEQVADRFDTHRLTWDEREQLYLDGVEWFRRYGVSMREVPPDRAAFQEKWDHYCSNVLEINDSVQWILDQLLEDRPLRLGATLRRLRPLVAVPPVRKALLIPLRIVVVGGLPQIVRERFEIPWSRSDRLALPSFERAIGMGWRFVPFRYRWHPRALAAWRRVEACAA